MQIRSTDGMNVNGCLKHGHAVDKKSRTYASWRSMKNRCSNRSLDCWPRYGGRGISVCERWAVSFIHFLKDMGVRPEGTSIDRIDNDGNYTPENCRWATRLEQGRNCSKKNKRLVTWFGKTMCVAEWSRETGISETTLFRRLDGGWSAEKALTTPSRNKSKGT